MNIISKKTAVVVLSTAYLFASCSWNDARTATPGKDSASGPHEQPESAVPKSAASPVNRPLESSKNPGLDREIRVHLDRDSTSRPYEKPKSAAPKRPASTYHGPLESSKIPDLDREIRVHLDSDFKFVARGFPLGLSAGQTRAGGLRHRPFEMLSKEPVYHSKEVLYGYLELGNAPDNKFTFVIDDLDHAKWSLWVDVNNNNDLTDDGRPLPNKGTGKLAATVSPEVEVRTSSGEKIRRPYQLWFWVDESLQPIKSGTSTGSPDEIDQTKTPKFYATCHYEGMVKFDNESHRAIAFEQFNHDALYRDSGLWIDLNRDGKLDKKTEHFQDHAPLQIGDKTYQLLLDYP